MSRAAAWLDAICAPARAEGGDEEGQITPAGRSMRAWLNALGANAGPDF